MTGQGSWVHNLTDPEAWARGISDHSLAVLLLALSHNVAAVVTTPGTQKWWRAAFIEAAHRLSPATIGIEEEQ